MVNLVYRTNAGHTHTNSTSASSRGHVRISPSLSTNKSRERRVPSPIVKVPSYPKRPLSPLTATDSIFAAERNPATGLVIRTGSSSRLGAIRRSSPQYSAKPQARDDMYEDEDNEEPVCDYDDNLTTLYELLEASQWDEARLRCRTNPEEVQTWIVRRDDSGQIIRWKLLPLHAAVIFQAPATVLECLLQEYPTAAERRDDQGMLPLHLAFRHHPQEDLLELLLRRYPAAARTKDLREKLPMDHAGDVLLSSKFVRKYSEAILHSHHGGATFASAASSRQRESQRQEQQQQQQQKMQEEYEERIKAMQQEHQQDLLDLQEKMEEEQNVMKSQHEQEMDDLRDLLSRQAGQHVDKEMKQLRDALSRANLDNKALRELVRKQDAFYEDLQGHMQQILKDQKKLQAYCERQQEELEEAEQLREQLLRSLSQDNAAAQNSQEICQLSQSIRRRTEQLLNRNQHHATAPPVAAAPIASAIEPKTTPPAVELPEENGLPSNHQLASKSFEHRGRRWRSRNEDARNEDEADDISAITEDHY